MNNLIKRIINNFYKSKISNRIIKETIDNYYLNESEDEELLAQDNNSDLLLNDDNDSLLDRANKDTNISVTYREDADQDDVNRKVFIGNVPSIYAFTTEKVPNFIKVGFTNQSVERRLQQWNDIYHDVKEYGRWTATETMPNGSLVYFMDYPVHDRIINKGYARISNDEKKQIQELAKQNDDTVDLYVSNEFFRKARRGEQIEELNAQIISDAIDEIKQNIKNNGFIGRNRKLYDMQNKATITEKDMGKPADYNCTPQQEECVNNGIAAIEDGKKDLLMAAVMRFGKTHTAYEIISRYNMKHPSNKMSYIVVTSAKADTRIAWRNDINHIDFIDDFVFLEHYNGDMWVTWKNENGETKHDTLHIDNPIEYFKNLGKTVIVYSTLQYLLFDKDETILEDIDYNKTNRKTSFNLKQYLVNSNNVADLLIVDEAHFGSHAAAFGVITGLGSNKEYNKDNFNNRKEYNKAMQNKIPNKCVLQCSGTPYYILQGSEFNDSDAAIITTVSWTDMLNARNEWEKTHPSENIRYDQNGNIITDKYTEDKSPYFGVPNIHKFGMQLTKECRKLLKNTNLDNKLSTLFKVNETQTGFVYEDAIVELMKSIFGVDGKSLGFLNIDDIKNGRIFRHTVMNLPSNYACHLMRKLLLENNIINENDRKIIVAVDKNAFKRDNEAEDSDILNETLRNLDAQNKKSLTITDQRFLTGVSVPLWDSMLYMKDTKSPQEYDQAIFRLCTRNIVPITSNGEPIRRSDGSAIKRNAKPNVYLIDFNIDRMYDMAIKTAKLMCKNDSTNAEGYNEIEKSLVKSLDSIPIYEEPTYSNNILSGMHKVNIKDLMKYYVNYNKNKSIDDQINDAFNEKAFDEFCGKLENIQYLEKFGKSSIGASKADPNTEGTDYILVNNEEDKTKKQKTDNEAGISDKEAFETNRQYMKGMIRTLLYCNICLDEPVKDMNEFFVNADENILKLFNVSINDFRIVWNKLSTAEKKNINRLLINIYELFNDKSIKDPIDRAIVAIKKLGRLDDKTIKGEVALVVTPESLVNKMIDKVPESKMKNAESILEVNSKYGEFLIGIYKKYGKSVAEKVKLVPGDDRCKAFCKKILNILGISEYNILEIEDIDGNGKYDVRDFLKLENSEILDMNKGKKRFNCALMNPPYDRNLHLKFLEKVIDLSDTVVNISPIRWLQDTLGRYKDRSDYKNFENSISKHIEDLDIISAQKAQDMFQIPFTYDIAIYTCTNNGGYDYTKVSDNEILANVINKMKSTINDHLEFSIPKNAIVTSLITGGCDGRNEYLLDLYYTFESYKKFIYDSDGKRLDNGLTFYENRQKSAWGNVKVRPEQWNIKFNNIDECLNYYNFTKLYLFRYLFNITTLDVHVQSKFLPFMDDYSHAWTDEELFNYFDISEKNRRYIKSYIDNILVKINDIHNEKMNKPKRKKNK